jgi:4-hydroxybenzoate polyprenyltransferase
MAEQTWYLVLKTSPNFFFLSFIFFATITSYSFHWHLPSPSLLDSPRLKWIKSHRYNHAILFLVGLMGATIFFFYLLPYWPWLLLATVITFFYSAPKIPHRYFRLLRLVAIGKTIFLAGMWMYATTFLPIIISSTSWKNDYTLFILSRFFLIYSICILFDYRDRADDKAAGIRSMITYLNEQGINILFTISLAFFTFFTLCLLHYHYSLRDVILLLIPGLIIGTIYDYAKRNFSDIFYYLVLDGLMVLSALLMLVFRI